MTETEQTKPAPKGGRDLPVAIGVGVALFVPFAVGLTWLPWLFIVLAAAALTASAVEIHMALSRKGMRAEIIPIAIGTPVSVIGAYVAAVTRLPLEPTAVTIAVLGATVIAVLVTRLLRGGPGFIRDVAASSMIIAYIPVLGMFVPLLMAAPHGRLRILTVIVCVVAADTGAYAVGSLLGRHKMAPAISPGKTWEGLAGGVVIATVAAILCTHYLLEAPWWIGLIFGVLVSLAATVGDLVESLIKREVGLKDMSNFLPGHGGVMDRLDSMLVAFPVGWLLLHFALAGIGG